MEFVAPALQLLAGLLHTSGELETQLQVCLLCLPSSRNLAGVPAPAPKAPHGGTKLAKRKLGSHSRPWLFGAWSAWAFQRVQVPAWPCLQVFNLFNLIIERLGDDAKPYGPGILQLLPAVWQQAEGQSLLRIQVWDQHQLSMSALISPLLCAKCICIALVPTLTKENSCQSRCPLHTAMQSVGWCHVFWYLPESHRESRVLRHHECKSTPSGSRMTVPAVLRRSW